MPDDKIEEGIKKTKGNYKAVVDRTEAIKEAIKRLIIARSEATGNAIEQERINAKLTKLYALKYTALEQSVKGAI